MGTNLEISDKLQKYINDFSLKLNPVQQEILDYNNISNYDIYDINLIIESINKHSIDIIYLENIPFLKNIKNNKIYFINFLWTNNTNKINKNRTLLFDYKYSNKYLLKNFLKKYLEKKNEYSWNPISFIFRITFVLFCLTCTYEKVIYYSLYKTT